MAVISGVEKWLEKVIDGFFSKGFKTQIQPIEIGKKLVKEMINNKTVSISKTYVPDYYIVNLSLEDWDKIKSFARSLSDELADYLLKQGTKEHYIFLNRPEISLQIDEKLSIGQISIETQFREEQSLVEETTDTKIQPVSTQNTQIYSSGQFINKEYGKLLVLDGPDKGKIFLLNQENMIIGRKNTNEVFLNDSNVSRCHARITCRNSLCILTDLGSTNGTIVNGTIVTEKRLEDEDVIEVGVTTLVFKGV